MNKKLKKVLAISMVVVAFAAMCVIGASAADGTAASEAVSAVSTALGEVTGEITIANVVSVIGIALAASVGFFFMWFGVRWVIRKVTKAIKSGRLG